MLRGARNHIECPQAVDLKALLAIIHGRKYNIRCTRSIRSGYNTRGDRTLNLTHGSQEIPRTRRGRIAISIRNKLVRRNGGHHNAAVCGISKGRHSKQAL